MNLRSLDAQAVAIDVAEIPTRFRVVAIKPSGVRADVVACPTLVDAERCVVMLVALGANAAIETETATRDSQL